jgi:hypothetical protein
MATFAFNGVKQNKKLASFVTLVNSKWPFSHFSHASAKKEERKKGKGGFFITNYDFRFFLSFCLMVAV